MWHSYAHCSSLLTVVLYVAISERWSKQNMVVQKAGQNSTQCLTTDHAHFFHVPTTSELSRSCRVFAQQTDGRLLDNLGNSSTLSAEGIVMKEVRDRFYVEGTLTGYLDHGPNDSESPPEPITVKGADVWAAIEDHGKRVFNRELIPVVRFLCGPVIGPSPVWYWVPPSRI
jgi:hypothetical protein